MKKLFLLILVVVFLATLAGCNKKKTEENPTHTGTADENQLSPEELEQGSKILLPVEDQIKLKQELNTFYGSEEAFMKHGFVYIDEKRNNKGVIGIKELNSTETEKLQKQIYQKFTKEEVEFIKADYTMEELSEIQDEVSQFLYDIDVLKEVGEESNGSHHMTMSPNLKEQKIKLEISPITDEQLQVLKEKFGDTLLVNVTY